MKKVFLFISTFLGTLAYPGMVRAIERATPTFTGIENPSIGTLGTNENSTAESGVTFLSYFIILWRALINIGALAVIIYFVWGAFDWITAGGDSGKIQKARDKIMHSIIGIILLVSSFFIISLVGRVFFGKDFDLLNLTFISPFSSTNTTGNSTGNTTK